MGIQKEPPQDMPEWYPDYFELKATDALQTQDIFLSPPHSF